MGYAHFCTKFHYAVGTTYSDVTSSYSQTRNRVKKLILLLAMLGSSCVQADYSCHGKVNHFGLSDSLLNIHNGHGVHRLCNLTDDYCKGWMSTALSAKMADRELVIYYRSATTTGNQSAGACSNIGNWVTPSDTPYYIEIK